MNQNYHFPLFLMKIEAKIKISAISDEDWSQN